MTWALEDFQNMRQLIAAANRIVAALERAHPAPPEPAKEADDSPPFSPEAAKDFAARGFERVNRPAPPAVAIGERSLGQVALDAVSESDTRPWRDLQTYTREKWEEAAEAVREVAPAKKRRGRK